MRKIRTMAERIDEMLASYSRLDREAHELFDLYVDELRLEYPHTPVSHLKMTEITARAGTTLNIRRGLEILRERRGTSH